MEPDAAVDIPWPGYVLHEFRGLWSLPHTIAWGWSCTGTIDQFSHYELCISTSPQLDPNATRCLGPNDDPTLAFFECGGPGAYHPGIVGGLEVGTTYYAFVRIIDTAGTIYESEPASFSTKAMIPSRSYEIFSDDCACTLTRLEITTTEAAAGAAGLVMTAPSEDWFEGLLTNLLITPPDLDAASFSEAYLELLVDSPHPARVWTSFGRADATLFYAPPAGHSPVDGAAGFQILEVPISRMLWGEGTNPVVPTRPITFDDFRDFDRFGVGARWGSGKILVDEIRIRY